MKIDLTKKQYECLIKVIEAGSSVYSILGDSVSEEYKNQSNEIEDLREYFIGLASNFGMDDITEEFEGELIMSDDFSEKLREAMDDYDNEIFWDELETRLGKRDFERTMTPEERKEIEENNGLYTDRIHKIYERWGKELEENGIEMLEISENIDITL